MTKASVWMLFLLALMPVASPCIAQPSLQQSLVAMVRVSDNDIVVEQGAALVVHQSDERTLLVTAYHILREPDGQWKGTPQVEFFGRRGTLYAATYNSAYADKALDLAVLFIDHSPNVRPPPLGDDLAQGLVSPNTEAALLGAPVRVLGFMESRPWASSSTSDRILASNSRRVSVRSTAAAQGASGGAIVDSLARLVAMGSKIEMTSDGPILQGVPISAIHGRLEGWGLPFDLRKTDAPSAGGAIDQRLRGEMRIDVSYGLESSNGPWRHVLRAAIPPDIAALVSHIEIEYRTAAVSNLVLRPPNFSEPIYIQNTVPMPFRAVVVLHDGRRLGPYETVLDLSAGPAAVALAEGPEAVKHFARALEIMQKNADDEWRRGLELEDMFRRERENSLKTLVDKAVENSKASYIHWRILCVHIKEPTVDNWKCSGDPFMPMAGGWPHGLEATAVFEDVRLGARQDRVTIAVPLAEWDSRPQFLDHAATVLQDGADELYVTVRLVDGAVLGPKQLCVVIRSGGRVVCR